MASYLLSSLRCGLSCSHRYSHNSSMLTACLPLNYCLSAASAFQKDRRRFSTCRILRLSHVNSPALGGALHVRCTDMTDFNATANHDLAIDVYDRPLINPSRKDEIMDLPSLIPSMAIAGLPPPGRAIAYETETKKQMMEIVNRWEIDSLKFWTPFSISWCSFTYSGTVSLERFVALTFVTVLTFLLDDLLFDSPKDSLLEEFGIDRAVLESPAEIGSVLRHLWLLFQSEVPLEKKNNLTPIEGLMWECGQRIRLLSNPEWFTVFSDSLLEHFEANVASESEYIQGRSYYHLSRSLQDMETYSQMRMRNSGAFWCVMLQELTIDVFLHRNIGAHPTFQQLVNAARLHLLFVNDIFSYSKEVVEEPGNPRNLMSLIMVDQFNDGRVPLELPQTAWRMVEIINANARTVLELEKKLLLDDWEVDDEGQSVHVWVEELKAMMSGNLHWHAVTKPYRHPEAVFPVLRDRCAGIVD